MSKKKKDLAPDGFTEADAVRYRENLKRQHPAFTRLIKQLGKTKPKPRR